ncbi:hypothetical protein K1719_007672 [Acacia pycnantha]|nr:hypothetical protein K1719_007672 [Acacia pycnantha]
MRRLEFMGMIKRLASQRYVSHIAGCDCVNDEEATIYAVVSISLRRPLASELANQVLDDLSEEQRKRVSELNQETKSE